MLLLQVQYAYELLSHPLLKRDYDMYNIDEHIVSFLNLFFCCINIHLVLLHCNSSVMFYALLFHVSLGYLLLFLLGFVARDWEGHETLFWETYIWNWSPINRGSICWLVKTSSSISLHIFLYVYLCTHMPYLSI